MSTLSAEQYFIIADEFCAAAAQAGLGNKVRITKPWVFAAVAAAARGEIGGISAHSSPAAALGAVRETIIELAPLSSKNAELAAVVLGVLQRME